MRAIQSMLLILAAAAVTGYLCYGFWEAYQPQPTIIQGQIEAQQYNISSKVAGRIDTVHVKKGEQVSKGQLIFTIYSPELEAKLAQAKAGQDAAEALAEEARTGARSQEIAAARDSWQKAKAASELLEKTYQRIENLYKDGVIPEQKRDEVYTELQAARYTANAAFQLFQMAEEGAREETKQAAEGKARMAAGAVAEVEAFTADTQVTSWHSGEVSQVLLQDGELAPQGFPVVTLLDMNDSWAVFNIREDLLSNFTMGTTFRATLPALDNKEIELTVTHIAAMGDFATWRATNTSKGFDMRTFEVEARPKQPIESLRAGMSVIINLP